MYNVEIVWNAKVIFWMTCHGICEFEISKEIHFSSNVGFDLFPEKRYLED